MRPRIIADAVRAALRRQANVLTQTEELSVAFYRIRSAVMTFGAGLTVPSFDLVVLPLTTGPVFLPARTFFSHGHGELS